MEFIPFPSTPRLSKEMIITEKLDWTNACIVITEDWDIYAQSRNRIITIEDDNYWFARRVYSNKEELKKLWVWYFYWERRGRWIQRWYNEPAKRFSLFVFRWEELPDCVSIVPTLYAWEFSTEKIDEIMNSLKQTGSIASPWFNNPEGIVIFHTGSRQIYKKTFDFDKGKRTQNL